MVSRMQRWLSVLLKLGFGQGGASIGFREGFWRIHCDFRTQRY